MLRSMLSAETFSAMVITAFIGSEMQSCASCLGLRSAASVSQTVCQYEIYLTLEPETSSGDRYTEGMKKESDMLFLVIMLLCWTQTEASAGGCSGALVSISGGNSVLPAGQGFKVSCEFTCLSPQHVTQLWRESRNEDRVSLVNITSNLSSVILVLSISSATKADTGYYFCRTQPPDTISPKVAIQIADNVTTSTLTTPSTPRCDSTQQHSSAAGLQGQIWYWILLGKTAILLLLSLASLAVKYKRG
ncbi:uncharacterized protein LOC122886646 isoform X2 [Siniperca chuatsi]|uniref:uncharacterized protein LOC122886646 isoform X2 n=1 Tax=Siniperca chuatsi TaxID=119488 RepID=UPI001CE13CEA|nr:uncharacterized protein LOC122886646 isoform X2 [Siniperca chuatsi]